MLLLDTDANRRPTAEQVLRECYCVLSDTC